MIRIEVHRMYFFCTVALLKIVQILGLTSFISVKDR